MLVCEKQDKRPYSHPLQAKICPSAHMCPDLLTVDATGGLLAQDPPLWQYFNTYSKLLGVRTTPWRFARTRLRL